MPIRAPKPKMLQKKSHFLYTDRQNRCFKELSTQKHIKTTDNGTKCSQTEENPIGNENKKTCEKNKDDLKRE